MYPNIVIVGDNKRIIAEKLAEFFETNIEFSDNDRIVLEGNEDIESSFYITSTIRNKTIEILNEEYPDINITVDNFDFTQS